MPLSAKQERQKCHIEETYKKRGEGVKKGRGVFYAMERLGKISGGHKRRDRRRSRRS